jgi:hypothetical protein
MKACLQRTKTAEKENLFAESRSSVELRRGDNLFIRISGTVIDALTK